jgi:hypothetical protein
MQGYSVKVRFEPLKTPHYERSGVEVEIPLPPVQIWTTEGYWDQVRHAMELVKEAMADPPPLIQPPYNTGLGYGPYERDSTGPSTYPPRPQSSIPPDSLS